jgi:deoxyhypusine synthase
MKYQPINLAGLRTVALATRPSKVQMGDFAGIPHAHASFQQFFDALPNILFGQDLRTVVAALVRASRNERPIIFGMGAHVIKCGLSPVIIALMEQGIITCVATNGAGAIHDVEIALVGQTSEDVQAGLKDGSFGMSAETSAFIQEALDGGTESGLGWAIGQRLRSVQAPYQHLSILATAARLRIPMTVHVAIGTDIVHMQAGARGDAIGGASFVDFRLLAAVIADLTGGVYINAGSAVILPEVFLKAFTIVQNRGANLHDFTTINIDMIQHYRPTMNVLQRPASVGGTAIMLNGRHELLIPLLAFAVIEALGKSHV